MSYTRDTFQSWGSRNGSDSPGGELSLRDTRTCTLRHASPKRQTPVLFSSRDVNTAQCRHPRQKGAPLAIRERQKRRRRLQLTTVSGRPGKEPVVACCPQAQCQVKGRRWFRYLSRPPRTCRRHTDIRRPSRQPSEHRAECPLRNRAALPRRPARAAPAVARTCASSVARKLTGLLKTVDEHRHHAGQQILGELSVCPDPVDGGRSLQQRLGNRSLCVAIWHERSTVPFFSLASSSHHFTVIFRQSCAWTVAFAERLYGDTAYRFTDKRRFALFKIFYPCAAFDYTHNCVRVSWFLKAPPPPWGSVSGRVRISLLCGEAEPQQLVETRGAVGHVVPFSVRPE